MNEQQIQRSIEFCRSNIDQALGQLEMPKSVRPMLFRSVHDHFHPRGNWGLDRLDEHVRKVELHPELWSAWYEPALDHLGEETVQHAIASVKGWHETMRAWRIGRQAGQFQTIDIRMDHAITKTRSQILNSICSEEGRKYDINVCVDFGVKPKVDNVRRSLDRIKATLHATPAWMKKVGRQRAVMFKETKHRTFIFDSESFDNSEMNNRGVSCFKLHGFGVMKEHYHKAEIAGLQYQYNQLNKNENLSYVDAFREYKIGNLNLSMLASGVEDILYRSAELIEAYKSGQPCHYSMFYLEHENLDLSSVGHTFLHARNLLNRRLKKATLDALS